MPDIMVVMSQEAYVRFGSELKDGGIMIVEQDLVRVADIKKKIQVYSIPATRIAEELGKRMVLNSVMVGFFTAVTQLLEPDAVRKAVADSVPSNFRELNLKAFERGLESRHRRANLHREPRRRRTTSAVLAGIDSTVAENSGSEQVGCVST